MIAFTCIGIVVAIFVGVPALFIVLDCACARIARALRDSIRP
jgi:hypothetical protein